MIIRPHSVPMRLILIVSPLLLLFSGRWAGAEDHQKRSKKESKPSAIMMKVRIQDSYDPISKEDLDTFETDFNLKLPQDYRQFLLWRNGGYIKNPSAMCVGLESKEQECHLSRLLGLHAGVHYAELEEHRDIIDAPLMKRFLAIGFDDTGSVLCLGIDAENFGQVYYWDRFEAPSEEEIEEDESVLYSNMYFCGNSFNDFLNRLEDFDPYPYVPKEEIPLLHALESEDWPRAEKLLAEGADINLTNEKGWTPLMVAIMRQRGDFVEKLIEKGADIHQRDKIGKTPLCWAVTQQTFDCFRVLVEHGARINDTDNRNATLLITAFEKLNFRAADALLTLGIDLNVEDNAGRTALSVSTGVFRERIIKLGGK